ncbi:unnamed protein product [Adineta ricciae]|uniref:Uncharacterized protein n=1 Tax=Adineta ricciae TaxID=249248 RepID=A0A815G0A4_ADIRI|nr:unnamed protein product [Adineta ricciae]CAF1628528.1 unnamed protein product [Adineta ricciae]
MLTRSKDGTFGAVWSNVCVVHRFLLAISIGAVSHLHPFPEKKKWHVNLTHMPVVNAVTNNLGAMMIAVLYGVPYVTLAIAWMDLGVIGIISYSYPGWFD